MKDAAEIIERVNDVVRCLTGDRPFGRIICDCYGGRDSSGSEKYCVARHLFTREYRRLEVMRPLVGRKQVSRDQYVLLGGGARDARVSTGIVNRKNRFACRKRLVSVSLNQDRSVG